MNAVNMFSLLRDLITLIMAIVDVLAKRDAKTAKEILSALPASEIARQAEILRAKQKFSL